jgi:Na+/proline symporter
MEPIVSSSQALGVLASFVIAMISIVVYLDRKRQGAQTRDHFLVANRNVNWKHGALSIAVSWVWAPAIFITALQAYTKGAAGAFWFIVPNVLCFFLFAPFALRLRRLIPDGFTLPEFIIKRFDGNTGAHIAFLFVFFGYQLGALIINALAGGTLLSLLTGLDFPVAVLAMASAALIYSLISGMEASVITDVVQMLMIIVIGFILVPFVVFEAGGISAITGGLGGVTGEFSNMFHPGIAFAFGIPMALSLLSGPIGDQMFFQRGFSVRQKHIVRTFVIGGLIFAVVPLMLTLLGFIAANPAFGIEVSDPQMVAPITIAAFLPKWAVLLFTLMAFAGLASTIDSAYVALSSLGAIDIYKRYVNPNPTDHDILRASRTTMLITAIIGTSIALLQPKLLWVFLIYGALASAGFVPTMLSIAWNRLTARGAAWAVGLSLLVGTPLSFYANITGNETLIVIAAIASVAIGAIICLVSGLRNNQPFDYASMN